MSKCSHIFLITKLYEWGLLRFTSVRFITPPTHTHTHIIRGGGTSWPWWWKQKTLMESNTGPAAHSQPHYRLICCDIKPGSETGKACKILMGKSIDKSGLGTPRIRCEMLNMQLSNISCEQGLKWCPKVDLLLAALNKLRVVPVARFTASCVELA
jgi:hypothetical protein